MASPKCSPLASKMSKATFMITNKRLAALEEEMKAWKKEMDAWRSEKVVLLKERDAMKDEIDALKAEIISIRDRSPCEEGEIVEVKEAMKEEITKAVTKSIEMKTKAIADSIEGRMDAKKEGWVEIVRKNLRKEVKEETQIDEHLIVQSTIEEEKMRQARRLNVRVTGIEENKDATPEMDGRMLCTKLGYKAEEPLPFLKAWRAGKDLTKKRALILQFPHDESRSTFLRKRMILRGLDGPHIYLDEDLTKMQVEHRRACMPRVHQARKEGKKASYRDGRIIIEGRAIT